MKKGGNTRVYVFSPGFFILLKVICGPEGSYNVIQVAFVSKSYIMEILLKKKKRKNTHVHTFAYTYITPKGTSNFFLTRNNKREKGNINFKLILRVYISRYLLRWR